MACGRIDEEARDFRSEDEARYNVQYLLVRNYYPPQKHWNKLVGIIFYSLKRAKRRLPREQILVRRKQRNGSVKIVPLRPMRGDKFIEISPDDPGYPVLHQWWRENCTS